MTGMQRLSSSALFAAILAGLLLIQPPASLAAARISGATAQAKVDIAGAAAERLNKPQFEDVKVSVENGIATLTGTVTLYEYKIDAERRVRRTKGIEAVRNTVEVAGPAVPDRILQARLSEELEYDRVGFGNAFNAIAVSVENGVVTLGGHARTYVDRDSALALVNTTTGVKDVVNQIEVDPVSPLDDQIRLAVARAIYGYPPLNRYAIDPARPIRISVQNGKVELYGMVDSQADKQMAFLRANGVPDVLSVKNYLQVAGQPTESSR